MGVHVTCIIFSASTGAAEAFAPRQASHGQLGNLAVIIIVDICTWGSVLQLCRILILSFIDPCLLLLPSDNRPIKIPTVFSSGDWALPVEVRQFDFYPPLDGGMAGVHWMAACLPAMPSWLC